MKKRKLSLDRETITQNFAGQLGVDGGTDESYNCDPQPVLRGTQTLKWNCYEVSFALCTAFCYTELCTAAGC
jgi:hypothetical protein